MSGDRERAADRIFVRDLRLRGIVGINEWERSKRQDIVVNLTLFGDFARAGSPTTSRTRSTTARSPRT